jgi:hypothetical protein
VKRAPLTRRTPLRSSTPPQRRTRLRPMSAKRRREAPARRALVEAVKERQDHRCLGAEMWPEVACAGHLEVDELAGRGVYPGGHLDPENCQGLCSAHHRAKHAFPAEAERRGLRRLGSSRRVA